MKWLKSFAVTVSAFGLIVLIGCSAVMDAVTPCYIEPDAGIYAEQDLVSWLPFTTLFDAERVDTKVDLTHQLNQLDLLRLIEDDNIRYGFLKDAAIAHIQGAREFQKTVFSPEGPIGLLGTTIMGGTLGALLINTPKKKENEKQNT